MKTSGVFHISDHLQLTIKSLHVLFPSISLLKKHSALKLQKQSVFILQHFRCLNTKKVKIKKYKREYSHHNSVFYFRTKFETSNARGLVFPFFFRSAMISKGVRLLRLFEARVARGRDFTWIFRGFHPLRTAPIGFSVRPICCLTDRLDKCVESNAVICIYLYLKLDLKSPWSSQ